MAYLRAVSSEAGVGCQETSVDEDALAVDCDMVFAAANARVRVKCTGQFRLDGGGTPSWAWHDHWWRSWHGSKLPVYFVLVIVDPDLRPGWLDHHPYGTLYRAAAFWARVDQLDQTTSIQVSKSQRLTAATMQESGLRTSMPASHQGRGQRDGADASDC